MSRVRKEEFTHGTRHHGRTCDDCRIWLATSRRESQSRCWIGERAPRPTWRQRRKCRRPSKSYLPVFSRGGSLDGKSAESRSSRYGGATPDPARGGPLRPPPPFP